MDGKTTKLTQQQQEQVEALQHQTAEQKTTREFGAVEEMLRFDSSQNPVPGKVAERLQESVERAKIEPPQPWWKKLFGK